MLVPLPGSSSTPLNRSSSTPLHQSEPSSSFSQTTASSWSSQPQNLPARSRRLLAAPTAQLADMYVVSTSTTGLTVGFRSATPAVFDTLSSRGAVPFVLVNGGAFTVASCSLGVVAPAGFEAVFAMPPNGTLAPGRAAVYDNAYVTLPSGFAGTRDDAVQWCRDEIGPLVTRGRLMGNKLVVGMQQAAWPCDLVSSVRLTSPYES